MHESDTTTPARQDREPDHPTLRRDWWIVVIGAGPGGISSGHFLREAGFTNFTHLLPA